MCPPKVSVLMAVYKPNLNYFRKQLSSINNQTYSNIELLICDDSGDFFLKENLEKIVSECIYNIEYKLIFNMGNLGSNKTFEKLTLEATGDYFSYSDQDDIWEDCKIEKLVKMIMKYNGVLAYSDLATIDEDDHRLSSSFKKRNFRLKHIYGYDCFFRFLRRNSVTGCTMLIKSEVAKMSCPFPKMEIFPHDHWLAICSSAHGRIVYSNRPLVNYRIHVGNQIGDKRFIGINSINDYYNNRIMLQKDRLKYILKNLSLNAEQQKKLNIEMAFLRKRDNFFNDKKLKNFFQLIKYMKYDIVLICFEVILFLLPKKISEELLNKIKS